MAVGEGSVLLCSIALRSSSPPCEQDTTPSRLTFVNRKATITNSNSSAVLAKGQLWKINDAYIQIVERGKMLIHYKMMKKLGQMQATTRMSTIDTLESYLKINRARLVTKGSR